MKIVDLLRYLHPYYLFSAFALNILTIAQYQINDSKAIFMLLMQGKLP